MDITDEIEGGELGSFADDTKAWQITTSMFIQRELGKMYKWAEKNNSEFNGKKFVKVTYGDPLDDTIFLAPDGTRIASKTNTRDLGVEMSADAKFDIHINNIVRGTQKMSAWTLRTFRTRKTGPMLTIWTTLVRGKVEYASFLWSPTDAANFRNLEKLQRRFTSKFAQVRSYNQNKGYTECKVNYWERLQSLKMYSLQRKRERYVLCYIFKIHAGMVPDLGFLSDTGKQGLKYFAKENHQATKKVQDMRRSSFFTQGPLLYNLMPMMLRETVTLSTTAKEAKDKREKFKKWLDR